MKRKKKVQCRVYRNRVFFYGKTADLIQRAIEVSGLTPEQFLAQALKHNVARLKAEGLL
jgi:hypothetical protein